MRKHEWTHFRHNHKNKHIPRKTQWNHNVKNSTQCVPAHADHILSICSIATRTRKSALPEILFGGCKHSLWIATASRHIHNPKNPHRITDNTISTWFQLDHPQHGETHNKHIPDNHSTITPFTSNRSRHVWIKSDGTHNWNQKPSSPATTTSKLANLDSCTPRETPSQTIQELTRTAAMISELRAHEKMLASHNVQCTHAPQRNRWWPRHHVSSCPTSRVQSQQKWPHVHPPITHNTHMNHQNSWRNNPSNKLSDRESSHAACQLTSDIQTKNHMLHKTVRSWNYVPHHTPIPKQIMVTVKEWYRNCAHHEKTRDWTLFVKHYWAKQKNERSNISYGTHTQHLQIRLAGCEIVSSSRVFPN